MPIGDLLASITGEKSFTTPSAKPAGGTAGITAKRKAEDDGGSSVQKAPRIVTAANGSARPTNNPTKTTNQAERSSGYTGSARPTPLGNTPRSLNEKPALSASKKPSLSSGARPSPTSSSFLNNTRPVASSASSALSGTKQQSASVPTPTPDANAKAPKKGSYAEIKARAAAAHQKLQTIGKIQHKAIEKQPTKKEKAHAAAEGAARFPEKGLKPGSKPGTGLAARNGSNGAHANGSGLADRTKGLGQKGLNDRPGKAAGVEERKPKKAALATTGYTGSARAPPSKTKPDSAKASASGKDRDRHRQPNPMGMFGSRRPRDEEYDEEMDDFVVDDEEEEDAYGYGAPRYRYADDDDESDMEAGYTDMEVEDTRALRLARLEDEREEAILQQRRQEKEAKKKALLQRRR